MGKLRFRFQEVIDEVDSFSKLARSYLQPETIRSLDQLRYGLESMRDTPSSATNKWEITEADPVRTTLSSGRYQPDDMGARTVFGEVSCIWEIRRIPLPGKKNQRAVEFEVVGNASTKVRLLEFVAPGHPGRPLAMWRAELGADDAPGCFFHVQILGEYDDPPFPKNVDVPRLPGLVPTPPAVMDFMLGELFQQHWVRESGANRAEMNRWAPIQQRRLTEFLKWQLEVVGKSSGSPWLNLKARKPDERMFA